MAGPAKVEWAEVRGRQIESQRGRDEVQEAADEMQGKPQYQLQAGIGELDLGHKKLFKKWAKPTKVGGEILATAE